MLFCFFKNYFNLAQSLTAQQLFLDKNFDITLQTNLQILKKYENQTLTAKINYLVVRMNLQFLRRASISRENSRVLS